jgi:hypothetical protein
MAERGLRYLSGGRKVWPVGTSYPVVYRVIQDPPAMSPPGIPSLRRHKPSSQAVVTLGGKDHYLGVWPARARRPPAAVQQAYEALIAEWLAGGRVAGAEPFTVSALILRFLEHAQFHYRRADGSVTHEVNHFKQAFRDLRRLFGHLVAVDFSPLKLKALRDEWVKACLARTYINQRIVSVAVWTWLSRRFGGVPLPWLRCSHGRRLRHPFRRTRARSSGRRALP